MNMNAESVAKRAAASGRSFTQQWMLDNQAERDAYVKQRDAAEQKRALKSAVNNSPEVKQAEANLAKAKADLADFEVRRRAAEIAGERLARREQEHAALTAKLEQQKREADARVAKLAQDRQAMEARHAADSKAREERTAELKRKMEESKAMYKGNTTISASLLRKMRAR